MNRLDARFAEFKRVRRTALIPFITAGDPSPQSTVPILHALVAAGADIVELGVPFSDPMADGPVIQRASERALANGVGLRLVLQMVSDFRRDDARTPIVLMGYANPIEAMGYDAFARGAQEAGVDGVIVVDYPPEEAEPLTSLLRQHGIATIFLLAPTTPDHRITAVGRLAQGYVYYVSLKGVTGAANLDLGEVAKNVAHIRDLVKLPVGVGFGIRNAATAVAVARHADAVVIGSALVQVIEQSPADQVATNVNRWLADIRHALDDAMGNSGELTRERRQ